MNIITSAKNLVSANPQATVVAATVSIAYAAGIVVLWKRYNLAATGAPVIEIVKNTSKTV